MRDVVLYHLMSLDAVAFEDDEWFVDEGPQLVGYLGRVIGTQDDVLLGRGTYDYWAGHWPKSDFQPFADFINGTPKHVFASRPFTPEWANTSVVTAPAGEHVAELKRRPGGDIGVHGSMELARSLLADGLVDKLRLVVSPATVGRGRRVFDGGALGSWRLEEMARAANGTLFLDYERAV
ncbi:dihydrofolate reductase [Sphaerisporangium rufum]|uniref:Dihydrofolate reductase n=1 Tax=Sphaerisporangium rufum TaxID=1381558 RepID=A0A919R1G9_9ACTN|nr:dihydrofolate reductase family protein [Sphaerisporangium rufum]GII78009.1 dihydrofolate reductase [Sphaerisporangium rufum]